MLKTFSMGGIHPAENKITANKPVEKFPVPQSVTIPVAQHIGAPATPVVNVGDRVKVGQLIAKSEGFVSGNIHASVSGTVKKIEAIADGVGFKKTAIVIETEGDEWLESIDTTDTVVREIKLSSDEIINKIFEAGLVGLGGAAFPAHVKLKVPEGKKAECLLINAAECEPFLTCDHRIMLEKSEEVLIGVQILMKALNVTKAYIGIENNKPDAIERLSSFATQYAGIEIVALKTKYPQGGERQLIKATINRELTAGKLPIEVGAVVFNVGSAFSVYEAVQKNKPMFERVVTITGKELANPANYKVRIGTSINDLIAAAGGITSETAKVINGGPMMGRAVSNLDAPIVKGCSGITIVTNDEAKRKSMQSCIRCGKCVSVCSMGLEPYLLMALTERSMNERLEKEKVTNCLECGSCNYICPASRPILDYIRQGKTTINQIIRTRKS